MRDFPGANGLPPLCVVAFFRPPAARAGVLESLQKWVCRVLSNEFVDLFQPRGSAHFFNGSNTPALSGGSGKTPLRIMGRTVRSWRNRASIFTPIEKNVWRRS